MSVIEIQKRVGLSRPTLYRLLHTLSTRGLIHAEGDPQRFKLAQGVMKLSHVWLKGLEVVNVARPIVESLRDATGETAALFSLQEDRGVCVLECESRHVLSISRGVGDSMKITQGEDVLRAQLEEGLKLARRQGYAISRGEIFVGAVAVSSPYYDHRGSVVGSVGLYGPNARVSDDKVMEFGKLVCDAGRRISALLGFQDTGEVNAEREVPRSKEALKSNVRKAVNLRSK